MHTKEIPLSINNTGHFYSDFLTRLGAGLLDGLIMSPIVIMVLIVNSQSLSLQYFMHAFNLIFACFYMIYLPKRYGGTPGKLISGLKIIKMDGNDLDWLSAFNRYSVSLALAFFTTSARYTPWHRPIPKPTIRSIGSKKQNTCNRSTQSTKWF